MEKKRFLKFTGKNIVYQTKDGKVIKTPWALVEGYIATEVELKTSENQKNYVICRMGTGANIERQFDYLKNRLKDNYEIKETYFLTLKAFGKIAERFSKVASKGKRMLVWGEFGINEYTNKDGEKVVDYFIEIEDFMPLSFKRNENLNQNEEEFIEIEDGSEEIPF